jgi:hypothetical protein
MGALQFQSPKMERVRAIKISFDMEVYFKKGCMVVEKKLRSKGNENWGNTDDTDRRDLQGLNG